VRDLIYRRIRGGAIFGFDPGDQIVGRFCEAKVVVSAVFAQRLATQINIERRQRAGDADYIARLG
jgi:hypothetical protein